MLVFIGESDTVKGNREHMEQLNSSRDSKIVCMDFDDTVCRTADNMPFPGVREALKALSNAGYRIIFSSSRFSPVYGELNVFRMKKVEDWLSEHGVPYHSVSLYRPAADIYVDDKGYLFKRNWETAIEELDGILRLTGVPSGLKRDPKGAPLSFSLDGAIRNEKGELIEGAAEALSHYSEAGWRIVISLELSSCSDAEAEKKLKDEKEWLAENNISYYKAALEKLSADLFISDRGYSFNGDWQTALPEIEEFLSRPRTPEGN